LIALSFGSVYTAGDEGGMMRLPLRATALVLNLLVLISKRSGNPVLVIREQLAQFGRNRIQPTFENANKAIVLFALRTRLQGFT
jgi:hypothetical protein